MRARTGQASRPAPASGAGVGGARATSIEIEGLTKVFQRGELETHALAGIDLQVATGEFLAVVGPSGCGKSTLLRLIAGLIPPSQGRIAIDGRSVIGPETRLGIVFQKPILLEWRTVLGNVLLQAEMRRLDAGSSGPAACCPRSASRISRTAIRMSFPVACSSEPRSYEP